MLNLAQSYLELPYVWMGLVAQSVSRLTTGWTVRGSNQVWVSFSIPVQTGPGAHPVSCKMGTGSFPGVKRGRSVKLTTQTLLVPWARKSRAIPLLPLWAVRPVQCLSTCTRVPFTFTFTLCVLSRYIILYFIILILHICKKDTYKLLSFRQLRSKV